ncbi:hypothetical protein [Bradyrhizobium sp. S3.2.12]|uniref:hypothetical protein n=1 Tax=Bradyrhizobium sp. S3.2.12 TaxID=3156387 RepID=UPI003397D4BC
MGMSSQELREREEEGANQVSNEVQFALVIARMIETVKADPELMRRAVYDLARHKLQEQLVNSNSTDTQRAERALETAIHSVEEFSRQQVSLPAPSLVSQLSSPLPRNPLRGETSPVPSEAGVGLLHPANGADRHPLWAVLTRTAAVLLAVGTVAIVVLQRERLMTLGQPLQGERTQTVREEAVGTPPSAPADRALNRSPAPPSFSLAPSFPRPTDYGVYALGDDALTELRLLPGRPPDARVAISAAFKLPSKVSLPNGHPEFIVFRRETATNILERAEVRVIARIAREFSAESAGRRPDDNDSWVIRNFSYPYRASPVPDNPEMYRLHSEDPTRQLPPGQYALILKNQSYYFSVEGAIVDPRQCIERVITTSGTFYSACKTP